MAQPVRYGLIGCGGFGRFCLSQYLQLPGIECVGVTDINASVADRTAKELGVKAWPSPADMLESEEVDLVHIATPPSTHESLGLSALRSGKHVLIEKPLAITMEAAIALQTQSCASGRLLAVNLMMRYSPLCQAVRMLVQSGILGAPVHAHFVNDARDEKLPPDHWFWNGKLSGGIFVEHGVHFFHLFEWWFGPGRVLNACELRRPHSTIIDQVHCTAVFGDAMLANFYHGFHQAARRDQQEWMIVFETGTLRMKEWVPTTAEIDFVATQSDADRVASFFPNASLVRTAAYQGEEMHFMSRHRPRTAEARFLLTTPPVEKDTLYGDMVRALILDQIEAIRNPAHVPRVSGENGVSSLAYAVQAQHFARQTSLETI